MFVVCISNNKGGVGKTTTALALASTLASRGRRVVTLELDPQGNLGMGLGVHIDDQTPTMFDLLRGKVDARQAAQPVPHAGMELLRFIPAGKRLFRADAWLYGQMGFEEILLRRLAPLSKTNEFAVLDCSPSLGALTMNAIRASDLVLVPVQCEYFSVQGVENLLDLLTLMRRRNPALLMHVLPTLFDGRNRICKDVLAEMQRTFVGQMSKMVIGVDTKVRDSQASRTPLCLYAPKSRASRAYEEVALEVEAMALGARQVCQAA